MMPGSVKNSLAFFFVEFCGTFSKNLEIVAADHQSKILMKGFGEVGEKFFKKFPLSDFYRFSPVLAEKGGTGSFLISTSGELLPV